MYFGKITDNDVKIFHDSVKVDDTFTLDDIVEYSNAETITSDIVRFNPLFYPEDEFSSTNTSDKVIDNKCIIATDDEDTNIKCGDGDLFQRTYIETYDIGDTLSVDDFNKIIYLLKKNNEALTIPVVLGKDFENDYCKLEWTESNPIYTDKGLVVTSNSSYQVNINNRLFQFVPHKLKITYLNVNALDYEGNPSEFTKSTKEIDFTNSGAKELKTDIATNNIILYNAEIIIDLNSKEYKEA